MAGKRKQFVLTEEFLTEHYLNKKLSVVDIQKLTGFSNGTIKYWLLKYEIPLRSKSEARQLRDLSVNPDLGLLTEESIKDMYENQNMSLDDICSKFNVSRATIYRRLVSYGIDIRSPEESWELRNLKSPSVNVEFFLSMSPELAYILGVWASDGNLSDDGCLALSMGDFDVVEWIANAIGYKHDIKTQREDDPTHTTLYRIRFYNPFVEEVFRNYGITERKSRTLKFPENLPEEYYPHFIRGVFDGDGTVTNATKDDGTPYSFNCGIYSASLDFITKVSEIISSTLSINRRYAERDQNGNPMYYFLFSSLYDIMKFADYIYGEDDSFFGMRRKKEKFKSYGWLTPERKTSWKQKEPTEIEKLFTKEYLSSLYEEQMMTAMQIASNHGTCQQTVLNYLHDFGIKVRNNHVSLDLVTKEVLYSLYVVKGLSSRKIGKELGISNNTVLSHLRKHDIPIRSNKKSS